MDGRMAMVRISSRFAQALATLPLVIAGLLGPGSRATAHAQATPRITSQVENSALVSLPGAVHPWARAQFDRGPAPANMSGRMLLVLKRSKEQEAALQTLLAAQQDPHSPNYHKWLTPDEFGKRFGVADSDLQTVTSYLSAQGMSVGRVYGGHMAIEVGASAAQIKSTFQTEIHAYSVGGKTFYANNSNPKIPSALRSVVSGFAALNNFKVAGGTGAGAQATLDAATHTVKPLYTTTSGTSTIYGVSPADLAAQYGIPGSAAQGQGGKNVIVGIVGDSDINISYVNNYRSIFGLGTNPPVVIVDGNDPGVNSDAYIAYKQIELVSAVAPKATIYYYTSADTDYDTGMDFALIRAISDNQVQVLLNGFQSCETAIGSGGMELINQSVEQAAAQGMTVVAAAGNTGSAACEVPGTAGNATSGYAVNGYATSPFLTAVGGTDFHYGTGLPATHYWTANSGFKSIQNAPIPEQVWNDSFPNYSNSSAGTSVELAGGGGISTAGADGISTPQPIPSYQFNNTNARAISSTSRIIPDVSFFAGSGANNTEGYNSAAYLFCMQPSDCQSTGTLRFTYSGGTEASSAVFAGAVALAVNKLNSGSRFGLGNVNPSLYSHLSSAVSAGATIPANDVTIGNNELKCTNGTLNCSNNVMTGYAAAAGYDAASGLGSFNIGSFVTNYAPFGATTASAVTLTVTDLWTNKPPVCGVTPNCTTHSALLKFTVTAKPASGTGATATGDVAIFTSSPLQAEGAVEALTLSGGTAADTWNLLPGGTYNLYARYAGDATYASSVSTPYPITVKPEACQMVVYGHNINIGSSTSIPYGTPVSITVEPYSSITTNNVGIPSGSINVSDNGTPITTLPLNSEGATTFSSNLLAQGSHSITLTYPGDASFSSCSTGPYLATITKAATTTTLKPSNASANSGFIYMTAVVQSATFPNNGTAPTGTVTFNTNPAQTVTLVQGFDPNGNAIATASISVSKNNLANGSLTATYNPAANANYTGSSATTPIDTSSPFFNGTTTTSFTITDTNGVTSPGPYPASDSLTLNIHVASPNADPSGCPTFFGFPICSTPLVSVYADGILLTNSLTVDSNGNTTFTLPRQNGYLALPSGQVQIDIIYSGYYALATFFAQDGASSTFQTITISDDRTNADFSLQSDTTVNQSAPLVSPTTQATYNLRLTSIYNFNSAYSSTPIKLTCSIIGYSLAGVRNTVPAGLTCGFGTLATTTVNATIGTSGYSTKTLVVGPDSSHFIASNVVPAHPAGHWWIATGGSTLACIFLLGLPARRRKWQSLMGACVMIIASFGMTGCGASVARGPNQSYYNTINGGSGTPNAGGTQVTAGTYTVLVTATATTNTTLVHTLPVKVLVGTNN
jgi:subtilase family serine protease